MIPGDIVRVEIEKCIFGGDGLARVDGQVIFVPGALPGEVLTARIGECRKNFCRAQVLEHIEDSPFRTEPACPVSGACGGCAYHHVGYDYETELKQGQLLDFLRAAGIAPEEPPAAPAAPPPELGYRNKLTLHVRRDGNETRIGYIAPDRRSVLRIETCPLAHGDINAELRRHLHDPSFGHTLHDRMTLTYRRTVRDGVKFWRNRAPQKASWLREETSVGTLSVPWDGFFQVNIGGAEALISEFRSLVGRIRPDRVLDLYCGVGLFSAVAADRGVPSIAGAEMNGDAVACAGYNLARLGRPDAVFQQGDAADFLSRLMPGTGCRDLAIADPPRTGMTARLLNILSTGGLKHLAYVSCHPATWSRDVTDLTRRGWRLIRVSMINQFARTAHFEVFSYLDRG